MFDSILLGAGIYFAILWPFILPWLAEIYFRVLVKVAEVILHILFFPIRILVYCLW